MLTRHQRRGKAGVRLQHAVELCARAAETQATAIRVCQQAAARRSEEMERRAYEEDRRARRRLGFGPGG